MNKVLNIAQIVKLDIQFYNTKIMLTLILFTSGSNTGTEYY